MTRSIKVVVIILIFVFSSTISFAFQNEPSGFRRIKWGSTDKVGEKGYKLKADKGEFKVYNKTYEDPVFYRDGIKVRALSIWYYTFEGKFMSTKIICKPSDWNSMKKILISLHGSPTKATDKGYFKTVEWIGQKTNIKMIYTKKKDSKKKYVSVGLFNKEINKEYSAWKKDKKSQTGGF